MRVRKALVLGIFTVTAVAHADPSPRALVEADADHMQQWWSGFMGVYTAALVTQTGLALSARDEGARVDAVVSATTAALGVGSLVITPLHRLPSIRDEARRTGDWSTALTRAADAERSAFAWYNHVACAVVGLTAGAILWLGYNRPETAVFSLASSVVVGELNLWLMPRRSLRRSVSRAFNVAPTGTGLVVTW
ncbi:MAG: hypothetical protein U0325_32755 [Polyangiales bacterium]